ncbi:hypothetical protein DI43_15230 [Geobacillus sp. CAMR12739]|nr:hypothetical protein DI43_15230 [Geobacillus sp. CAMR12739]
MAQIQRLYDFQAGTRAMSQQVDDELNQLVNAHNTLDTALTNHKISGDHDDRYYRKTEVDVKVNDLQTQITANKSSADSQFSNLNSRVTTNTNDINSLKSQKADKTYVDQKVADIQNGQIADNAVSTVKIQDGAVTTPKLANGSVTAQKVDGVTVYTASQVDGKISNEATARASDVTNLTNQINTVNARIDNLQYNKDLYSAKQDIIVLALNVEVLKGAQLTGISQNMVIETLADVSDLTITQGLYDSTNKKIYLP